MIPYRVDSAGLTDVGLKRAENEDSIFIDDVQNLWVVADGMGGHENGALASRKAVEGFQNLRLPEGFEESVKAIADRIHVINDKLVELAEQAQSETMGTTGVALLIRRDRFAVAWVGDSRAYIYRRGGLFQLTTDHTHVQDLVDQGVLTQEAAEGHPMSHVLTRALGTSSELQVDVVQDWIEPGDRFLICSDGLTGPVADSVIREQLSIAEPETAVQALVQAAHAGGAPDNVSVIVIAVPT